MCTQQAESKKIQQLAEPTEHDTFFFKTRKTMSYVISRVFWKLCPCPRLISSVIKQDIVQVMLQQEPLTETRMAYKDTIPGCPSVAVCVHTYKLVCVGNWKVPYFWLFAFIASRYCNTHIHRGFWYIACESGGKQTAIHLCVTTSWLFFLIFRD
jgi:hypothetical protein